MMAVDRGNLQDDTTCNRHVVMSVSECTLLLCEAHCSSMLCLCLCLRRYTRNYRAAIHLLARGAQIDSWKRDNSCVKYLLQVRQLLLERSRAGEKQEAEEGEEEGEDEEGPEETGGGARARWGELTDDSLSPSEAQAILDEVGDVLDSYA